MLACGAALAALLSVTPALGQTSVTTLSIPAQPVDAALRELARKTGVDVLFPPGALHDLRSKPISGAYTPRQAAEAIVAGDNLEVVEGGSGSLVVRARTTSSPQSSGSRSQADDVAQVAEVVVTASKRAERQIDVPYAVSAVTGADLRRTQSSRFEDYLTKLAGVNFVSTGEGTTQIFLRGITAGGAQASSTVGIYIDEAPYGSSTPFAMGATSAPDLDPSDVDRIEVLRGPQGTLYGANALGGVIKFVTAQPNTQTFSGRLDAGAAFVDGAGDGYNVSGGANVPLVHDELAIRISAYDRQDPGYIDDTARGLSNTNVADVQGGKAALLYTPTDNLRITLSALGQDLDLHNLSTEDVNVPGLQPVYGDLNQSRYINSPSLYRYRLYNGTLDWRLGGAELVSSTSYATFNASTLTDASAAYGAAASAIFGAPGLGAEAVEPVGQTKFTQEIRLQSSGHQRIEWRAGLFFDHEHSLETQSLSAFVGATGAPLAAPDLVNFGVHDTYNEYAGFGDLTVHVTDRFAVTAGARYSVNQQDFTETQTGFLYPAFDRSRSTRDGSWTWMINPEFKLTPDFMVYGRIATGYRPGGPTLFLPVGGAGLSPTFQPDTLTSYEVGAKSQLMDRRVTLEADLFDIEWNKIQLNEDLDGFQYITNGGSARSRGAEATAAYTPLPGLQFTGAVTYTEAELTESVPLAGGQDGDRLPEVPRWNGSVDASYTRAFAPSWDGFVGGSVRYIGDRLTDFALLPNLATGDRFSMGSYTVGDLRAGVSHNGVTFTVYVKNVGDSRGVVALGPNTYALAGYSYQASIIQPRTFGFDLSSRF